MEENLIKNVINISFHKTNKSEECNKPITNEKPKKFALFGHRKKMEKEIEELKIKVEVLYAAVKHFSENGDIETIRNLEDKISKKNELRNK